MHDRERVRIERCEATDRLRGNGREGRVAKKLFCRKRWLDDVGLGQGRSVARVGEEITAEKRPRRFLA